MTKRIRLSGGIVLKKNSKQNIKLYDNIKLIPVYIVFALIPLIVKEHYYNSNLENIPWYASGRELDMFLYWKSIAVIVVGISMILILWFGNKKESKKLSLIFVPLIVFELFLVMSSILSPNAYFCFHGIGEQFESLWVWLAYGITVIYSYVVIRNEEELKRVVTWLTIGITGVLLIGLSQLFELDFYKLLYQNKGYNFMFEPGRVYGSFYNPNYVGTYVSLLFPVILTLFICKKEIKSRLFTGVVMMGLLLLLVGSRSTTGFLITGLSTFLLLVFYRKKWLRNRKVVLISSALFCCILFAARGFIEENVVNKIKSTLKESISTEKVITKIETNDDNIVIEYMGNSLYIDFRLTNQDIEEFTFYITDEKNVEVASDINYDSGVITLTDERFRGILINAVYVTDLNNLLAFTVTIGGKMWNFTNQVDGTYYYITNAGKLDKIKEYPSAIFTKRPDLFSGRGYIWSKTIPLLSKTLILGTGVETFMLAYPNDDYVGNYNMEIENTYITRPHNMYLQMGVQTGVISLISFLCFYFIYAISCIMLYWKNECTSYESNIGLGIFIGTVAYMLVGIINDSTVTVAPIFWCLIGTGIGINTHLKRV